MLSYYQSNSMMYIVKSIDAFHLDLNVIQLPQRLWVRTDTGMKEELSAKITTSVLNIIEPTYFKLIYSFNFVESQNF